MPLKVSSNTKGTWITWETPDESLSATFRIRPEMPEDEMLGVLVKATTFIANQMGIMASQIAELELAIMGSGASPAENRTPNPAMTTGMTSLQATPNPGPSTADPNALRVPMMSPASLSDKPSDGGPANDHFGWSSMPTTSVPPELADPKAGGWELIPPGEM